MGFTSPKSLDFELEQGRTEAEGLQPRRCRAPPAVSLGPYGFPFSFFFPPPPFSLGAGEKRKGGRGELNFKHVCVCVPFVKRCWCVVLDEESKWCWCVVLDEESKWYYTRSVSQSNVCVLLAYDKIDS